MKIDKSKISFGLLGIVLIVLFLLISPILQHKTENKITVEESEVLEQENITSSEGIKNSNAIKYMQGKFILFDARSPFIVVSINGVDHEITVPTEQSYNLDGVDLIVFSQENDNYKILANVSSISDDESITVYSKNADLVDGAYVSEFCYNDAIIQSVETETFAISYQNGELQAVTDINEGAKHDMGVNYVVIQSHEVFDTDENLLITSLADVKEEYISPLEQYFYSKLNSDYFETHNYLVLRRTFSSGSTEINITDAKYTNNNTKVVLTLKTTTPEVATRDMSTSYVIVELDKSVTAYSIN